jgi:hypothetical protein
MGSCSGSNSDFDELQSTDSTTGSEADNHNDSSIDFATSEKKTVFCLRLLVFLALLLSSVGVCLVVFFLTSGSQNEEFLAQYDGSATKVIDSFQEIVGQKLSAVGSLSVTATSFAKSQPNVTWPFVTLVDYQDLASTARELSKSLFVALVPIVSEDNRRAWEKYSVEQAWWLEKAKEYNKENDLGFTRRVLKEEQAVVPYVEEGQGLNFSSGIADKIFVFTDEGPVYDSGPGPFLPSWQEHPTFDRHVTNFNIVHYPDYAPYALKVTETGEMALGGIDTAPPGEYDDPILTTKFFALLLSTNAGKPVRYKGDPMSTIFMPVFDSFDVETRKPAAVLLSVFSWATYFEGLLPANSPGVVVVIENNCDGPFTYRVTGENVEYVGPGNLHDSKFTHMERFVNLQGGTTYIQGASSLGIPLNQDICSYDLRVYPSMELYHKYHTHLLVTNTMTVALFFVITAGIFLLYNFWVDRRLRLVLNQAIKSTAIVSSLFPEGVRDRLISGPSMPSGKNRLKSFLQDGESDETDDKPIADLFPHCTVFFADIVGFTAWSSARDPAQVFVLLQTIYQAFDVIAARRKVFKVETIGDCYVAVTGLPNHDAKHFLTMARFAIDCREKFSQLVKKLEEKLGPDTGDLRLRVGLNRYVDRFASLMTSLTR